jgi:hypothetical protein
MALRWGCERQAVNNRDKIRSYRNVVNQEMLDAVGFFQMLTWVPEILARAAKEAGIGYLNLNVPCQLVNFAKSQCMGIMS